MNLGIDVSRGSFVFVEQELVDTTKQAEIVTKMVEIGLPIEDDYLYKTFGIDKPINYDALKKQKADEMLLLQQQGQADKTAAEIAKKAKTEEATKFTNKEETTFFNRLKSFFAQAPQDNGAEEW